MRVVEIFSNEHLDSFEEHWRCDNHDFERKEEQ